MIQTQSEIFDEAPLPPDDLRLIDLYVREGRPVDDLAYTDHFEHIFDALTKAGDNRSKAEVFRRLLNLRKSGRLPRFL